MTLDLEHTYHAIFKDSEDLPDLKTLGHLIDYLEAYYEIRIEKMKQNKLFKIFTSLSKYIEVDDSKLDKLKSTFKHFLGKGYFLLDIHILRDGVEICPKQNLSFELQQEDIIKLNMNFFC